MKIPSFIPTEAESGLAVRQTATTFADRLPSLQEASDRLYLYKNLDIRNSYIEMNEISAPATPAADKGRLYLDVSGAKTRLMVIFQSGAAQQIAIEP